SYADLVHLPPLAKPGRLARFVRLARRALKSLLRPWLAGQTEFNQLVIQVLETMNQELSALKAREASRTEKKEAGRNGSVHGTNPTGQCHPAAAAGELLSVFAEAWLPGPP